MGRQAERARALMREIGIEPATRFAEDLALSRTPVDDKAARRSAIAWRIRLKIHDTLSEKTLPKLSC